MVMIQRGPSPAVPELKAPHAESARAGWASGGALLASHLMSAKCQVCGKGPSWGMSVSHSHVRTKRRWNPNIQRIRALVGGAPKRLYVCTGCIKSGKVVKAGR
ncbi:MAG: ribosomal protein [Actinomycetota bacterium]